MSNPFAKILFAVLAAFVGCNRSGDATSTGDTGVATGSETHSTPAVEQRPPLPDDWFRDVTATSGVDFVHRSGRDAGAFTMLETFGSGVGLFDYDGDGDVDLVCAGGGTISESLRITGAPCRLYRNDGDFRFVDVTHESGLDVEIDYTQGITVGDVDRDGFPDLFVTCFGRSRLFVNVEGRRFRDATDQLGGDVLGWNTATCLADVTGDDVLDLYIAGYLRWRPDPDERCHDPNSGRRDVCMPGRFDDAPDRLLIGTGDGTFTDGTRQAGLREDGKGLGVVVADLDRDGHVDLYVANDVVANHLYLGRGEGRFTESAVVAGVAGNEYGAAEGSMGVDAGDFDRDGDLDLVVTNYEFEENDLYRNDGGGLFTHATVPLGLAGPCKPLVGFGTVFLDADSDGWLDLLVVNGHVTYHNRESPFEQKAFLSRNDRGRRFEDVGDAAGPWFGVPHAGRGVAVGDLNGDGAPDLVASVLDGPVSILENRFPPPNWIGIRPMVPSGRVDAVGASVRLVGATDVGPRFVRAGGSYLSHNDPRLLLPISDEGLTLVEVEVTWPSGEVDVFRDLATRKQHTLTRGIGTARE